MKSEFEVYMETGILGGYIPERAIGYRDDNTITPIYRDTSYHETERETFFSARHQTAQTATTAPGWPHMGGPANGGGSAASALVGLGHRLEQLQSAAPVMPVQHHTDRKVLQKEREKKIALGHKADDHEDEVSYDWQQTM